MKRLQVIRESESDSPYALVVYENNQAKAIAVTDDASDWANWVNASSLNMKQLNESLSIALYTGNARVLTDEILAEAKSEYGDHLLSGVTATASESRHEVVDAVVGHGRLYRSTAIRTKALPVVSSARLTSISSSSRQAAIEYKALSFRSESTYSRLNFEMKKVRAVWDPDLGPSGGWRCPSGSQFGGYITDRFGRGCGGGIIRRVGRALVNAGRRLDNIGEQRQLRRLNRAAERAQKPGAELGRVGRAAVGLERGAQRVLQGGAEAARALRSPGGSIPGINEPNIGAPGGRAGRAVSRVANVAQDVEQGLRDVVPNRRAGRRGINEPNLPEGRRTEIDNRLEAISRELDNLVDENPTPAIEKRIGELVRENRALRRERDGMPNRREIVRPVGGRNEINRPRPVRPALPQRQANRPERRQGARPVRKPVAERQRDGILDRAARRLVGDYNPNEYKPGDKERIKNRPNRYAKVKDDALLEALDINRPRPLRAGEGRDVEARRRQERLEILQEMVNRRMEIPDAYKREARVYKLKPQRNQRRDGLNRQGRAAVALERAAQRVLGGEERRPRNRPLDNLAAQEKRIANARKNRPANISDADWQQYNDYLDSIPDGNLIVPGQEPQLEPVLSFNAWKKNVQPNEGLPRVRQNRRIDNLAEQGRRIANARNNRPANISDADWQQYNDYLDSIPDGNLIIPGEKPQLEPVLSFNAWKKNVQPNERMPRVRPQRPKAPAARKPVPKPVPKVVKAADNLDGFSNEQLLSILKKHKEKDAVPFEVRNLSNEDLARLMDLLDNNQTYFLRREDLGPRDGYRLVYEEFNHRLDNNLWKTPKSPKAPKSVRARSRSARVEQAVSTPIRRPQPKRQRGKLLDAAQLDADQNLRLKRIAMDEKARLDADWRKRLGLGANDPITSRAIKDYIKQRENNKPGAYIGVLKANANDWDVLNDLEQQINRRPPRAALNPDHIDLINKVGPKRRQKLIDGANASTVGRIRSNRPTRTPKPAVPEKKPRFTPPSSQFNAPPPGMSPSEAVKLRKHPNYVWRGTKRSNALKRYRENQEAKVGTGLRDRFDFSINTMEEQQRGAFERLAVEKSEAQRAILLYRYNQATDQLAILRDAKKRHIAILDKNRADANKAPSVPKAPTPKPNTPSVGGATGNKVTGENAINRFRPAKPKKRVSHLPVLGKDGSDNDPMPKVIHPENSPIQSTADAVAHLNAGKPLDEVPREFWWDALKQNAKAPIGQRQFVKVAKNGGIIGDTVIYIAVDKKGQKLGQGFILKADKDNDINNVAEAMNFQLAHALGINIDVAGFDGSRRPGEMPAAIIPFAWNRAPDGKVITPGDAGFDGGGWGAPNFTPRQFDKLEDKAFPERLGGLIVNFLMQVPDRHDQNHMGAMIDGKPMVVPIDLGWGGRFGNMAADIEEYAQRHFQADRRLFEQIQQHLASLPADKRRQQAEALKDVYDKMLERSEKIIAGGKQKYIDGILETLSPEHRKNAQFVAAATRRGETMYDLLSETTSNMRKMRDSVFQNIFS